jgi:hypothetical protein
MVRRPRPSPDPNIAACAPDVPHLTDYDYTLFICYIRLLDAEKDGADWREVAKIVLKTDPDRNFAYAKHCYETHLARAHWMTKHGYRHLLREADDEW